MRFLLGALMLLALPVHAYFGMIQPWLQPEIRTGYVMTRAQVVSPDGNLFLIVEESSNASGDPVTREVRLVGEVATGGELDGFYVLSAADIRYYQNWYNQLRAERGDNVMDRAEWLDREQLAQGVTLANGTVVSDLRLADVTKKVLVLGERDRFGSNPDGWLLMQVPYDPDQVSDLEENVTSLLFDRDGNLLDQTTGSRNGDTYTVQTFTYRTAYFGQGEDAVEQSDRWAPSANDRIFGPMTSQTVRLYEPSMPVSTTNERGMYSLFWIMPCPFGGVLDFSLELELQARSYNPMGSSMLPLLMHHQTSAACSQTSSFFQGPNFYVDLIWMAGQVRFANELNGTPLPIGEELLFDASVPELTRAEYEFDFDGDGTADKVVQANKKVEDELDPETNEPTGRQFIVPDISGDPANYQWQAVYFSSGSRDPEAEGPAERQPDLWRVADRNLARDANNELLQAGRLTQISTEAALNTDVYIFRESTGELIVEVSGLPEAGDRRIVDNGRAYTWNTVMRGPRSQMFIGGAMTLGSTYTNQKDPQKFAEDLGVSSRFIGRDTGIPGPGETLRIVAINRTTGYTGSATFTLGSPSSGDNVSYSGSINQRVPELTLTPPNLKVWARRIYDIEHGLTQGEKAEYLIGHEGAATRNDTLVAIFTEWLDEYGKPLPEGLGENSGKDFGLSGRLAKLTGTELTPVSAGTAVDPDNFDLESVAQGSAVVEFGIKPGRQAQLIRLKADHVSNEHYYVNVFGRAINKEACPHCEYDQTGKNEGILAQRPNHYTPFYVPRYDEETTLALRKEREEQRRAEAEQQAESGTTPTDEDKLGKVEPQYAWMLRPEYQFSLIELTMNELQAVRYELDENGNEFEITRNLLDNKDQIIASSDDLIRTLMELHLPGGDPLAGFDGPGRQYVLAMGEDELLLEFDSNGQLQVINAQGEASEGLELTNLEHLSSLSVEDFLTIRLYLNSDPENVLWQWAFRALAVYAPHDHWLNDVPASVYMMTADEGLLVLEAAISPWIDGDEEVILEWDVRGNASVAKRYQEVTNGFSRNVLALGKPTISGEVIDVRVRLEGTDSWVSFDEIHIISGDPASISIEAPQQIGVTDSANVQARIFMADASGNPVDSYAVALKAGGPIYTDRQNIEIVNGVGTFKLGATADAGDVGILTASAGGVSAAQQIEVRKPSTSVSLNADVFLHHDANRVTISATNGDGPAKGVPVLLYASGSDVRLVGREALTDTSGQIAFDILPIAPEATTVDLSVCVGGASCEAAGPVSVSPGESRVPSFIVSSAVSGQFQVTRLNGDYLVYADDRLNIPVTLPEGATEIGSPFNPNRALLMRLPVPVLNDQINSEFYASAQRYKLPDNVVPASLQGNQVYGYTLSGNNADNVIMPLAQQMVSPVFAFKIAPQLSAGVLLEADSGLEIELRDDGRIEVRSPLLSGPLLSSHAIQWGQINAFYVSLGRSYFTLEVNGFQQRVAVHAPVPDYDIGQVILGGSVTGTLYDFLLYDAGAQPLFVFESTGEESFETASVASQNIVFSGGAGAFQSGVRTVSVVHSGNVLTELLLYPEEEISKSLSSFAQLPSAVVLTNNYLKTSLLHSYRTGSSNHIHQNNLYASISGETGAKERVVEVLLSLRAYAQANDNAQALEDIIASVMDETDEAYLESLAYFLQRHFIEYSASGRESAKAAALVPLLVLYEMENVNSDLADAVRHEIGSGAAMRPWLKFLSLPRNGWLGLHPPAPSPRYDCEGYTVHVGVIDGLDMPLVPCRMSGGEATDILMAIVDERPSLLTRSSGLTDIVAVLMERVPYFNVATRKYLVVAPERKAASFLYYGMVEQAHAALPVAAILAVVGRVVARVGVHAGKEVVENFVLYLAGRTNARIPSALFVSAMGYLYARLHIEEAGEQSPYAFSSTLSKKIERDLERSLLLIAMAPRFNEDRGSKVSCSIFATSQGLMLEVFTMAYFKAREEVLGEAQYRVVDVQRKMEIPLFDDNGKLIDTYDRISDIVLGAERLPVIVELKSASAGYAVGGGKFSFDTFKRRWPLWDVAGEKGARTKTSAHRQLLLDALAKKGVHVDGAPAFDPVASEYIWLWQDWDNRERVRYKRYLDPGVSIWQSGSFVHGRETYASAGRWLREHLSELGANPKSINLMRDMLNVSDGHKLPLGMPSFGSRERFYRFNIANEFESHVRDKLLEHIPGVWTELYDYAEQVKSMADYLDELHGKAAEVADQVQAALGLDRYKEEVERMREMLNDLDEYVDDAKTDAIENIGEQVGAGELLNRTCD